MALGARPGDVRRLILRNGLSTAAMGLAIGLGAVLLLAPVLRAFLYGVGMTDAAGRRVSTRWKLCGTSERTLLAAHERT